MRKNLLIAISLAIITLVIIFAGAINNSKTANAGVITGTFGASGGSFSSTQTNDDDYFYVGTRTASANVDAYLELNFSLTSLGIHERAITGLNISAIYCHSQSSGSVSCDGSSAGGNANGDQNVEAYNFSSSSWIDIGNLRTNDAGSEVQSNFSFSGKFGDFVEDSANIVRVRFQMNWTSAGGRDRFAYLLLEHVVLNVTYDPAPNVTSLNNPRNNSYFNTSTIDFNFSVISAFGFTNATIYGNWSGFWVANASINRSINNGSSSNITVGNLPEGTFIWNVFVYDNSSHNQSAFFRENNTFSVDTQYPRISLNSPANDTINLDNSTLLNVTVFDNRNEIIVKIYGGNETSFYNNNSLLYKRSGLANGTIVNYNWTAPVLNATSNTRLLMHFDLEGAENGTFAQDETGENNGTKKGVREPKWNSTEAKFGYSLDFDGADDELTINDSDSLDLNESFTISFWAYPRALSRNQTLLVKGSGTTVNYFIDYKASNKLEFGFYNGGFRSLEVDASSFTANRWNLISVTWNESSNISRIYVNGADKGSLQINYDILANSKSLKLGSFSGYNQNYSGLIDELVIYNKTLTVEEIANIYTLSFGDWYWRVEINDSANLNVSEFRLLRKNSVWAVSPASLGSIGAILDANVSVGIITINNTHPSKNITINITSDYNRPVIFNQTLPFTLYNTNNGSSLIRIQVNVTSPTTDGSRVINFNISVNDTNAGGDSMPGFRIVPVTLIASSSNPFLISAFEIVLFVVSQNNTGIDLKASVVNRGQGSAQNVQLSFVLPSGWTNTSGTLIQSLGIVEVNQQKNSSITVSINSTATTGTVILYANVSGQNSSGADLNSSYLTIGSVNVTVNAISVGAGPSVEIVVSPESGGGGGGGSGTKREEKGGGSESLTFSKEIEIVRGRGESFNIEVLNRFRNSTLTNVTLEIRGYPQQYISIFPDKLENIEYDKSSFFKVRLSAPIYQDYAVYVLRAIIRGKLETPTAIKDYLEIQNIKLVIQTAPTEETENILEKARKAVSEMKEKGFNTIQVQKMLNDAELKFKERRNKDTIDLANKIISTKDLAFRAYNLIERIKKILEDPVKIQYLAGEVVKDLEGNEYMITGNAIINTEEAREVLDLAILAFERGDYYAALERAEAARLLLVLEGKSNLKLFFYLYWHFILIVTIVLSLFGIISYRAHEKVSITRKIEEDNFEEDRVNKLIIDTQHLYFIGKISEAEYRKKIGQYRKKVSEIQKERLKLRNRRIRLLSSKQLLEDLEIEARQIENLIKKIQYDYYRDKKITEDDYKFQFNALSERLAEIEEEKATLELTKIKRQKAKLKLPEKSEIKKISDNLIRKGAKDIVIIEHSFTDRLKSLLGGKETKGKWIKINIEKSGAVDRMMEEKE